MTARDIAFAPPGTRAEVEEGTALTPRFDRDGLVACIAVDAQDGRVLMLAHMNAESLARTLETGEAWYWSRSRGELWHKGATSGQIQRVVEMRVDCDQDALLIRVEVGGDGGEAGGQGFARDGGGVEGFEAFGEAGGEPA